MNHKIAVVVMVYNPDPIKLRATLKSVLIQKDIDFEVVITDDGSRKIDWVSVVSVFEEFSFKDYQIVKNDTNQGTVRNLSSGLDIIDSEYVFTISPGDMLYDELTLVEIYEFCKDKTECSFFFGRAVYYQNDANKITIHETLFPKLPHVYDYKKYPWLISSTAFFSRQHICGASYFYRTNVFKKYINEIIDIGIKYVEDFSSAAIYVLDHNQVVFFDRNVVWYESNTGVSGSRNEKWDAILNSDINHLKNYLKKKYQNSPILEAKYGSTIDRIRHPIVSLIALITICVSNMRKNLPVIDNTDIENVARLLSKSDGK